MFSIRERLGVPSFMRAPQTKQDLLQCVRAPGSKTRLKEPAQGNFRNYDPFKEPMKWKEELAKQGIESEIRVPRKGDQNPVLVYTIH